jgi:cytidine deaminase
LPGSEDLVAAARRARDHARAAYSGFRVGAALECADGTIVSGCNIENATYGLTVCAERVALWKALSEGQDTFVRIAVVADAATTTPPCGPCRQLLWEYAGDIEVLLADLEKETGRYRLSALFPVPFDRHQLEPGG